jgi:hypothetical protein
MNVNKKIKMINIIYFLGLIFVIFIFFKTFFNSYIILINDYNSRVVQNAGDCNNQGYGFIKKIYGKYSNYYNYNYNYNVINFNNTASANSYFYNIKKKDNLNYLIILNPSVENLQNFLNSKHRIIEKIDNCYFMELQ